MQSATSATAWPAGCCGPWTTSRWSLGALVMHDHVRRLLGVDLTGRRDGAGEFTDYAAAAYALIGEGIFTDDFARTAREAFAEAQADASTASDPATDN